MGSFARVITILIAVFAIMVTAERIFGLERKKLEAAENRIRHIYGTIKENSMITASDILDIKEAASLCGGNAVVSAGCGRLDITAEDGSIKAVREFFYLHEIEGFIAEDGNFILVPGDSVSIRIETERRSLLGLLGALRKERLSVGGAL